MIEQDELQRHCSTTPFDIHTMLHWWHWWGYCQPYHRPHWDGWRRGQTQVANTTIKDGTSKLEPNRLLVHVQSLGDKAVYTRLLNQKPQSGETLETNPLPPTLSGRLEAVLGLAAVLGLEAVSELSGLEAVSGLEALSGLSGLEAVSGLSGLEALAGLSGLEVISPERYKSEDAVLYESFTKTYHRFKFANEFCINKHTPLLSKCSLNGFMPPRPVTGTDHRCSYAMSCPQTNTNRYGLKTISKSHECGAQNKTSKYTTPEHNKHQTHQTTHKPCVSDGCEGVSEVLRLEAVAGLSGVAAASGLPRLEAVSTEGYRSATAHARDKSGNGSSNSNNDSSYKSSTYLYLSFNNGNSNSNGASGSKGASGSNGACKATDADQLEAVSAEGRKSATEHGEARAGEGYSLLRESERARER